MKRKPASPDARITMDRDSGAKRRIARLKRKIEQKRRKRNWSPYQ